MPDTLAVPDSPTSTNLQAIFKIAKNCYEIPQKSVDSLAHIGYYKYIKIELWRISMTFRYRYHTTDDQAITCPECKKEVGSLTKFGPCFDCYIGETPKTKTDPKPAARKQTRYPHQWTSKSRTTSRCTKCDAVERTAYTDDSLECTVPSDSVNRSKTVTRRHSNWGTPCSIHGYTCQWDTPICTDE